MDKIINITVLNRIATADPGQYIICGNEDYTAVFDFDAEWSGIDVKTARFSRKGIYTDVVFTGNTVVIPEMQNVSRVEIGVFAGDITTTPAVVRCHRSILCGGGNVHEPEPDVYAQIIKMIEEIEPGSGSGGSGEDGGYYVPTVTQVDENTIQISYTASQGDMVKVNAQTITLPSGATGPQGEKGDTGADGTVGPSGYTPIKGTDYWTEEDRAEIRAELGFSESNVLGVENGGTGATTADDACEKLRALRIIKWANGYTAFTDGVELVLGYRAGDTDVNVMRLNTNYTAFSKPVTVESGGTGATTAAGAVAMLWDEIAKKIEATYNVTKK